MVGMCFSPIWFLLIGRIAAALAPDILRCDDALAKRKADQFDVGGDAELGADEIARVGGGLEADMQRLGDVTHGFFRQQHAQDFEFPRAQRIDGRRFAGELVDGEFVVDVGTKRKAPSHDFADRTQQRVWRAAFCDKAARARLDRLNRIGGALMHGEYQDARGVVPLPDAPDRLDPANARHRYVHDDEIGPGLLVDTIGVGPVGRLGDDAKAVLLLQQRAIALAHDGMVVRQHHAREAAGPGRAQGSIPVLGMVATSLAPPAARRSNRTVPPSEATRSCMPSRPMPAFAAGLPPVVSPSSSTLNTMSACPASRRSWTCRACACFAALVIASCAIR